VAGFQEEGLEQYLQALHAQYQKRIASLHDRLKHAADRAEAITVEEQLRSVCEIYKKNVAKADRLIF
jgi:deoxyadenosine/deoxycytidine kinase